MTRWEYHVVKDISESHLDEMGSMGWELVAVVHDPTNLDTLVFFFKRPLE